MRLLEGLTAVPAQVEMMVVVVLDNASDDGSADTIRRAFPSVEVIAQDHRAGFGANHNRVIAATRSRYVLVLNDDAEIDAENVARLVRYMDVHSDVGAAGPRVVGPTGRHQQTAWRQPTPRAGLFFALTLGKRGWVQSRGSAPRDVERLSGVALLLRRTAVEEVGGFDERFFMYAEDSDLSQRLAIAGHRLRYVPDATIVHHSQQSSSRVPERRLNEQWRSFHLYLAKHHGRLAGFVTRCLFATGFATKAIVARLLALAPTSSSERYRLLASEFAGDAAGALRGPSGPGLRELAADWNRRNAPPEPDASSSRLARKA